MTTLREVAERAGVSTTTASKVLSNTPYVSGETRARVLQVVAELDYVPNQVARALSKGRTHIVGVVIPFASAYLFDDPHLILFIRGVEEVLREREYALLLFTATSVEDAASAYHRLIRTRFVDGAIAGGVLHDEAIRQELETPTLPGRCPGLLRSRWRRK
ncbi:MAG: LacI family transcriptional regulator [Anaerolineae bacterium]|nr:LacI family transcriptional regulator [Anaerolineae bacterium]